MNVRCPVCGETVVLAVGDTRLSCTACGLAAPLSRVGTAPGAPARAMLALESDLTGSTIAGLTLIEKIGAGGMGTVYRGRGNGTDVAVKVLRPGLGAEGAAMLARFAREAEALRRLEHPRVVRFLDHGEDDETAYIVTELVEGRDLAARLASGRMTLAEIVDAFGQICDGVAAAHAAGIVHRDLKPANILVGSDGVKVADFGLAQLGADVTVPTLTRTDVAMGTFHYLAPEQRKDARNVDHRADVWALGVILYEMLTGELPLGSFVPPSMNGPGCDRRADAIVRRALAPDPAERYASVSELARDVRALVARPRIARSWIAVAATISLAGTAAIAFGVSSSNAKRVVEVSDEEPAAAATADAAFDRVVVASMDASIDSPEVATVPVDAGIDAAVVAVAPRPRPVVGRPTLAGGKAFKAVGDNATAGKPTVGKPTGGKSVAKPPAVCRSALQCCVAVKGENCDSWRSAAPDACTTALQGFRARTTDKRQRAACGVVTSVGVGVGSGGVDNGHP